MATTSSVLAKDTSCSNCGYDHSTSWPRCYECGTCVNPGNALLSWRKDWASWGLIREFEIFCSPSSSSSLDPACFDSSDYHTIPLEGYGVRRGLLEAPGDFVHELFHSTLKVSDAAAEQLVKLVAPGQDTDKEIWQAIRDMLLLKDKDAILPHPFENFSQGQHGWSSRRAV